MSFNAAQEARRKLQPKSRRVPGRSASPASTFSSGMNTPVFENPDGTLSYNMPATESFGVPSASSFDFGGGASKSTGFANPFAASGQPSNTNDNAGGEEDMARKKPFGGFSATTNSQNASASNIFGQTAPIQTSTGPLFANNGANSPTVPFPFTGTQQQTPSSSTSIFANIPAPSQPPANFFSQSQPQAQPQASNNKTGLFGNGSSSFNFPSSAASTVSAPAPSQPASASFPFGLPQTQTPAGNQPPPVSASLSFPPSNTGSIFSKPTAPTTGSPLFGSAMPTPAKATNQSKFGDQASSMFNIVQSKPPSQSIFASTSQPPSSTPAVSSAPSASLLSRMSSPKPASDAGSTTNDSSNQQAPKPFVFGAPSNTQENNTSGTSSSQSIFGNMPQKPVTGNFFGTSAAKSQSTSDSPSPFQFGKSGESTSASTSQPASDSSKLFQFLKPNDSATGNATSNQQTNGIQGLPLSGSLPTNQVSSKDSSSKPPFTFGLSQPSQTSQASEPAKSSNDGPAKTPFMFGQPQPSQSPQASQSGKSSSDGPAKTPFVFGQSQPSQTPQASQPFSNNLFGNLKPAQDQPQSNGNPKLSTTESNGTTAAKDSVSSPPSKSNMLFGNTLDSSKAPTSSFMQKHKPVRPSPLSQSMSGAASPDVEKTTNPSTFQSTSQINTNNFNGLSSIFGSPSKSSQQATQKDDVEKKEYDAAKRLRSLCRAVKASIGRMPVTADLSKLLIFYNNRRDEIMKDISRTKRKAVDDGADEDGSGPGPLKRQRQNNGRAAAVSTPNFVSSGESFKENEAVQASSSPIKPPMMAPPRPAFESPIKQPPFINGSTTPRGPPPTNIFAAQALMTPAPAASKDLPQTEKPKSTSSLFSAATSTMPRNPTSKNTFGFGSQPPQFSVPKTNGTSRDSSPPKSPAKQVGSSNSAPSEAPLFGSSNQNSFSSTSKQPAQPPQSNLFGSSFKQPSTPSASSSSQQPLFSFAPSGPTPAPATATASSGKRKPDSQLTKDDFEAGENGTSTPSGKRRATSQLTKDDSVAPETAPSTPIGKRKAEVQLTKDDYESGANGDTNKTPKTNDTRSETSKLFKNILDSPRQTSGSGHSSPQKKMFSLNKSDDSDSTPRPNPFASLGVAQSPGPVANHSPTPKTSAAAGVSFGSPATKNNDVSKLLFPGVNNGSSSSTSLFSASNKSQKDSSAASIQPASTNGVSFGNTQKPAASPFTTSNSNPGFKMPSFGAVGNSGVSAAEKFGQEAEKATEKAALTKATSNPGFKMPSFGAVSSGVSAAEKFRQEAEAATEKAALRKALDEDYDSDDDKAEFIKNWKEERQKSKEEREKKAKELSKQSKSVFIPGKGFSFSSQDGDQADSPKSPPQSPSEPPFASSTDVSRATSLGPTTSVNGSVLNGSLTREALFSSDNIFAKLSDSGTDVGKGNEADDESSDEGSEADAHDDEKKDPTYDPATEPEPETPDSPVEETGPGIASAKKPASMSALSESSTPGTSTPKGSLFDRISRDSDGNPIREIPIENKENTQPSSPFNFLGAPANQTWNQNSPIKFGAATSTAPSVSFTAATPPASKPFDFSASTKAPATVSGTTTTPLSNLFGAKSAATTQPKTMFSNLFGGSAAASSSGSETPTPTAPSGSSIFGNIKPAVFSGFGDSKPTPVGVFSGFGDSKPGAVGFNFGGTSTPASSSLFPSAAASMTNSRATTPGATATDNESNTGTEASGDPDAEQHEQLNLADSRAGEEDEEVLFECRAKALIHGKLKEPSKDGNDQGWTARGTGPLRILKHKETGATRTLLRSDPLANIVLNKGVLGNIEYRAHHRTVKIVVASDDGKALEFWLLQVKTEELAKDLAKVLEDGKPKA